MNSYTQYRLLPTARPTDEFEIGSKFGVLQLKTYSTDHK